MAFSFKKAKKLGLLSHREVERLAAVMLTMTDNTKPNFDVAAAGYDGTAGSYRNVWHAILKKLRDNNCYIDKDAGATVSASATTSSKKTAPGKRKAAAGIDSTEEDGVAAGDKTRASKQCRTAQPRPLSGKEVNIFNEDFISDFEGFEGAIKDDFHE